METNTTIPTDFPPVGGLLDLSKPDPAIQELVAGLMAKLGQNNPMASPVAFDSQNEFAFPLGAPLSAPSPADWPASQPTLDFSPPLQGSAPDFDLYGQGLGLGKWMQSTLAHKSLSMMHPELFTAADADSAEQDLHPGFGGGSQSESAGLDAGSPPFVFLGAPPLGLNPRFPREGWTPEQDRLLMKGKQAGWTYVKISEAMRTELGADISVNRLVKRFEKIRELFLDPLPEAIKNVMPEIMSCIKEEMAKMDLETLPQVDKQLLDEIVMELPRSIPKFVQSRVLRKRKTLLGTNAGHI